MLKGIGASQGYGIGNAVVINDADIDYSAAIYSGAESEKSRLAVAVERYTEKTRTLIKELRVGAGEHEAQILEGHLVMLNDPFLLAQINDGIDGGAVAEASVDCVCTMFINMLSGSDDRITQQRATDVKDLRDSLLRLLLGVESIDIAAVPEGSVLVAKDFTPSMTSQLNSKNVAAIISQVGGVTSHSAILTRAMGIPAVLSVPDAVENIHAGDKLIVDGREGTVIINPTDEQLAHYKNKQYRFEKEKEDLKKYLSRPTVTMSGMRTKVYGNIGRTQDAQNVLLNGGEGIGLFRTEFLFMDRTSAPSEEEQYEAYSNVAKVMDGREIIIRTMDIGGDKMVSYLDLGREDNPFLGHRGIRYCLDNPELFKTQIRAILRSAVFGDIKVMLPLVTTVEEVLAAKEMIDVCREELDRNSIAYRDVPVGVMIETPAAVLISCELAREVDFFSIGTNDLTGYTMAVDRGNAAVAHLYDPARLSVMRAIQMTIKNAHSAGIMVGMCGEAAADERIIPKLTEWGLDEFSVSPSSILQTRRCICRCR